MKAVVVESFGGVPRMTDVPAPEPGIDEVRVRLTYAGVNPMDWKIAQGAYSTPADFPLVIGTDGAGVVDEVGEKASRFSRGERVFGQFRHVPLGHGTEAQYAVVKESAPIARTPDGLDDARAAALGIAGGTALDMLDTLGIGSGSALLVVGATGGVGSYITQLASERGIAVIATARPGMEARMRDLGAVATVDHTSTVPLPAQVRRVRPGGVDAYIDLVNGKEEVARIAESVRPGGKVESSIGAADPDLLGRLGLVAVPFKASPAPEKIEELARMVVDGKLQVPVEIEPLAQAPEALSRSRSGHVHGKIVLAIPQTD